MKQCQCHQPGYCSRYRRGMYGRDWEICRGTNVDPGTSALWRALWEQESRKKSVIAIAKPYILQSSSPPGDLLSMTGAIYSLHRQYPGQFLTAVDTLHADLFANNLDIIPLELAKELQAIAIEMHHPAINECNVRGIHYMQAHCEHLGLALNIHLPLLTNHPYIYLTGNEKSADWPRNFCGLDSKSYWLVCSGHKMDCTAKAYGFSSYQKVIDLLQGQVRFVQVGNDKFSVHQRHTDVIDLCNRTTLRQLLVLAYHSRGGLGGYTLLQHVMAAAERPYVCMGGGREPVMWNSYPLQYLFHSLGTLDCCRYQACWKSRTVKLNDGSTQDNAICEQPFNQEIPMCMAIIEPETVAKTIRRINDNVYE